MSDEEAEAVLKNFCNEPGRLTDHIERVVEAALVIAGLPQDKVKEVVEDIRALD